MPSSPSTGSLRRLIALLGALVLLPLSVVLAAAPAQADPSQLTGTVTDAVGEALADVVVTVFEVPDETTPVSTTTTNGNGDYTLPLPPGEYRLQFTKAIGGYRAVWYGDGDSHESITIDDLGDASDDDGPLTGNVVPDQVLTSTVTHDVTGTVTGAGVPLAGISVTAFLDGQTDEPGVTATTAAGSGGYTLALETGVYQIRYSSPDYASAWYGADNAANATAVDVTVRTNGAVTVGGTSTGCGGADPSTLCPIALVPVAAGQQYPIAGTVIDANDDPIAGIAVTIRSGATEVASATTNATGDYSALVVAGTYTVEFGAVGWDTTPYTATDSVGTTTVTVAPNGDLSTSPAETLSANKLRTITLASTPTTFSGTVVSSASGTPAITTGIQVRAFPEDGDAAQVTATSNGSGTYQLGLPIGQYEIQFTDPGNFYAQAWLGGATHAVVKVSQGSPRVLTINGVPQTSFGATELSEPPANATYPVTGKVEDAIGAGIGAVTVTATAQAGLGTDAHLDTASDGSYTLQLEAGNYKLTAHDDAGHFDDGSLTDDDGVVVVVGVSSTGVITVANQPSTGTLDDIVLDGVQLFGLNGTVTSGGSALAGIKVDVYAGGDETSPSLTPALSTDSGGAWTTGSTLKIGTYSVRFLGKTIGATTYSTTYLLNSSTAQDVAIGQGGKVYVDGVLLANPFSVQMPAVTADTTYPVTGEVDDAVDEPLNKIHVSATVVSGGTPKSTDTAADGTYTLNLQPGSYQLLFTSGTGAADSYEPVSYLNDDDQVATVSVTPTGEVSVVGNDPAVVAGRQLSTVNMIRGNARWDLSGTVTSTGGAGLAGVRVEARTPGAPITDPAIGSGGTTSSTGAFSITNLPVGYYNLRLVDSDPSDGHTYIATWFGGDVKKVVAVGTGGAFKIDNVAQGTRTVGAVPMEEATAGRLYPLMGGLYDYAFEPLDGADVWVLPVGVTDTSRAVQHVVSGAASPLAASKDLGPTGVYQFAVPSGSYWLRYGKAGFQSLFLQNDDASAPATITITADGRITSSNLELDNDEVVPDVSLFLTPLAFSTSPKLSGKVAVGNTVTATFGALKGQKFSSDAVTVEWLLDGKVVDLPTSGSVGQKLKVPLAAAKRKLSFRITIDPSADNPDYPNAPSVFTGKAVTVPKAAAKLKGVYKKKKFTVTVTVAGLPKPTGKLVVKDGKKTVATIKLKAKSKGKVVVKLSKLKKGKHTLTLVYVGPKTVNSAKAKVKIKIA